MHDVAPPNANNGLMDARPAHDGRLRLALLGDFRMCDANGRQIDVRSRKARALLALLALEPGMARSRDRLMALLWGDRGETQARSSLRQALVELRRALPESDPPILAADRSSVSLDPDAICVDALELAQLAGEGTVESLERATGLYRGDLLEELNLRDEAFEDWRRSEAARLRREACAALRGLAEQQAGKPAIAAARRLLALDPLNEATYRRLMELLAGAGDRAGALRVYEDGRAALAAELGVEADAATRRLYETILHEEGTAAGTPEPSRRLPARAEKTSVAVLPFAGLSSDAGRDLFADGITEDLITELARYRHLRVIGYRMSSRYRDRGVGLGEIARELGADFLIEGSVRIAGNRVRVGVQLIDAETGAHAWARRFDREMDDIFTVQDEIVGAVVASLAFNLDDAASRQRQRDPTSSNTAYAKFLRARAAWRDGHEQEALQCVEEAARIDPDYGRAHAYIGYFLAYSQFSQWSGLGETETVARSRAAIERALASDRTDPFIVQRAAMTWLMLGEPHTALRLATVATEMSARDSEILVVHGVILAYCGRYAEGVAMLERAVDLERGLSPGCFSALAEGLFLAGDYDGSMAAVDMVIDPPWYMTALRAANLARFGRGDEANAVISSIPSRFDVQRLARCIARSCALPEDGERWLESFRMAGVDV